MELETYLGCYLNHFALFGIASFVLLSLKVGKTVISLVLRTIRRSFAVDLTKYGRWAVVTGSTDGIGKSYAIQMAEKGIDIVLISRNPDKLAKVAEEIRQRCKVHVKVIAADFKKPDIYGNIRQELMGLDIGILVNNVGMVGSNIPAYYCDVGDFEQYSRDIISVNILSCVMMTNIVLPEMLERKRGIIINIGSMTGLRPLPFYTMYSATKAFIQFFTKALNMEYGSHGVICQLVTPSLVETNMVDDIKKIPGSGEKFLMISADDYVHRAIQTIGKEPVTFAYWRHELQTIMTEMFMTDSMMRTYTLQMRNVMAEHLKKK